MSQLILVGGGARSGKSRYAPKLAENIGSSRAFVATAQAFDEEMHARIARHKQERSGCFTTIECPIALASAVEEQGDCDVILVDCLTLWITNLLGADKTDAEILTQVDGLICAIQRARATVIVVTNEVGLGLVSIHELGRRFQDLTGWAHQRLAAAATQIYFAALGCVIRFKPEPCALVSPDSKST